MLTYAACRNASGDCAFASYSTLIEPFHLRNAPVWSSYKACSQREATQAAAAVQKWLAYGLRQSRQHMSTSSNAKITPAIQAQLVRMQNRHTDLCKQLTGPQYKADERCLAATVSTPYTRKNCSRHTAHKSICNHKTCAFGASSCGLSRPQCCSVVLGESAAMMTPQEMGQVNKELSSLQPVIDTLTMLTQQRDEVRCSRSVASLFGQLLTAELCTKGVYACVGP